MNGAVNKYSDIIGMEHYVSKKRKPMSIEARAAQFAPFSALAGYSEAIEEKARVTERKLDLTDGTKEMLNDKLLFIKNNINDIGTVRITYFVPDKKKKGGQYVDVLDQIKNIDSTNCWVVMESGLKIAFTDISDISDNLDDKYYF